MTVRIRSWSCKNLLQKWEGVATSDDADCLTPVTHLLRMLVESALDPLKHMLMLPTRDPALAGRRAFGLESTGQTGRRPIATHPLAYFFARKTIGQPLAGRAEINIVLGDIGKILLAKAALGLGARGHGFGQRDGYACLIAGQNLLAIEVVSISHDIDAL